MKAILIWCILCVGLLGAALFVRELSTPQKGIAIVIGLLAIHAGLILKMWRAHK